MDDTARSELRTVREAVGVFADVKDFQHAVDELQSSGFDRHDLSMLANEKGIEGKLGKYYVRVHEAEDEPDAPRQAYRPPEDAGNAKGVLIGTPLYVAATTAAGIVAATGGALVATLGAIVVAGGAAGLIGYVFANKVDKKQQEDLMSQLDRGGLLLWVRTSTAECERKATEILAKHGASDIHVHDIRVPDGERSAIPRAFSQGHTERL